MTKRKRGRPPRTPDGVATEQVQLRLTATELAYWRSAAEICDMTLSAFIRDAVRAYRGKEGIPIVPLLESQGRQ